MKILKLALAIAAPAMLSVAFTPMDKLPEMSNNVLYVNQITSPCGSFKLSNRPYYDSLFTKKELKKLARAEKLRGKYEEGLLQKAAYDTEANDLERGDDKSSKTTKKIAKLRAKASSAELDAFKKFETACTIFKEVYTSELKKQMTDTSSARGKAATKLADEAQQLYAAVDDDRKTVTSDNILQVCRSINYKLNKAVANQELAFAILHNDKEVDYTQYLSPTNVNPEPSPSGNVAKDEMPVLQAPQHYDFATDNNIYRIRYDQFVDSLKVTEADRTAMKKQFDAEQNASQQMLKARGHGSKADTMRVYAKEAVTLTEREYYEQMAEEEELNECSAFISAINQNVKTNNALFELYQKYIPNIRTNNSTAKAYEDQAVNLYNMSKTYETSAAKQYSKVEKYTILSEGNELKQQAIANMENAIASYLGLPLTNDKNLAANVATARTNGIPPQFNEGEDESGNTVAQSGTGNGNANANDPKAQPTPAPATTTTTTPKTNTTTTTPKSNTTSKPKTNTTTTPTAPKPVVASGAKDKIPVSNSNAPAVSTWYYTGEDQRLKPYSYPAGTIFTVETGIYKEMPEPVDFPAVNVFVAEKLKDQNYMRYYLGSYKTYDAALAAQAMAKNGGYKQSVVSAFVNGKKTAVATAKANAEKQQGYQSQVQRELKELSAYQQPVVPVTQPESPVQVVSQLSGTTDAQPLSNISGTAYAVQISSVPTLLTKSAFNVNQLFYDQNEGGLYRYYTGVSTDLNIAKANLSTMKACGYEDAYIIKVSGGKNSGAVSANNTQPAANNRTIYRVQIGAYKSALSKDNKNKMEKLKKSYPVHTSQSGEYTVYTVGDCDTRAQADQLRANLVKMGYTESYVVTFINGVKQ